MHDVVISSDYYVSSYFELFDDFWDYYLIGLFLSFLSSFDNLLFYNYPLEMLEWRDLFLNKLELLLYYIDGSERLSSNSNLLTYYGFTYIA